MAQRVALERRAARRGRGGGWGRPAEATRTGQDPEPPSHVRAPLTGFSRQERGRRAPLSGRGLSHGEEVAGREADSGWGVTRHVLGTEAGARSRARGCACPRWPPRVPRLRPPPGPPPREARATRRGSVPGAVRVATSVSAMSPCGSVPCGGVRAAPPTSSRYSANVSRIDFCRKVRSSVTETRGPHFGGCPGSLRQRPGDAHRAGAPCVPSAPRPSPASQGLGATSPVTSSRFGCQPARLAVASFCPESVQVHRAYLFKYTQKCRIGLLKVYHSVRVCALARSTVFHVERRAALGVAF